jgi:hypothetical protein
MRTFIVFGLTDGTTGKVVVCACDSEHARGMVLTQFPNFNWFKAKPIDHMPVPENTPSGVLAYTFRNTRTNERKTNHEQCERMEGDRDGCATRNTGLSVA